MDLYFVVFDLDMYCYIFVLDYYFCMIANCYVNHNADFFLWYFVLYINLDIFGPTHNFYYKIYLVVHFVYC